MSLNSVGRIAVLLTAFSSASLIVAEDYQSAEKAVAQVQDSDSKKVREIKDLIRASRSAVSEQESDYELEIEARILRGGLNREELEDLYFFCARERFVYPIQFILEKMWQLPDVDGVPYQPPVEEAVALARAAKQLEYEESFEAESLLLAAVEFEEEEEELELEEEEAGEEYDSDPVVFSLRLPDYSKMVRYGTGDEWNVPPMKWPKATEKDVERMKGLIAAGGSIKYGFWQEQAIEDNNSFAFKIRYNDWFPELMRYSIECRNMDAVCSFLKRGAKTDLACVEAALKTGSEQFIFIAQNNLKEPEEPVPSVALNP